MSNQNEPRHAHITEISTEWQLGGGCRADCIVLSNGVQIVIGEDSIGVYRPGGWEHDQEPVHEVVWADPDFEDDSSVPSYPTAHPDPERYTCRACGRGMVVNGTCEDCGSGGD